MIKNECAILKGFDRLGVAVRSERHEARIRSGTVFSKAKVPLTQFRLIEQINSVAPNRAFSIVALPAIFSEHKSAAGKNRRVNQCQRLLGTRCEKPNSIGRDSNKGYIVGSWVYERGSLAVLNRHITNRVALDGQAFKYGIAGRDNPLTPALGMVLTKKRKIK